MRLWIFKFLMAPAWAYSEVVCFICGVKRTVRIEPL